MSAQIHQRHCQGPNSNKVFNEYERLQDKIRLETGVDCSILVKPHCVSIMAASYPDYVLARKCIKGSISKPIERAE
jgi:hypothetical protein